MAENWDQSVFDRTLKRYIEVNTKRTFPEILNSKLYFIARAATWLTIKADKLRIQTGLGRFVSVNTINKKGKVTTKREHVLVFSRRKPDAPLAALIVNARRRDAGLPGLRGRLMEKAINRLLSARFRSTAFIKSGWLPAVHALAPLADRRGAPPMDVQAKQVGRPKGTATPARSGLNIKATIVNLAFGNRGDSDSKARAIAVGERGLRRGFENETSSMNEYIELKTKPAADTFNSAQK